MNTYQQSEVLKKNSCKFDFLAFILCKKVTDSFVPPFGSAAVQPRVHTTIHICNIEVSILIFPFQCFSFGLTAQNMSPHTCVRMFNIFLVLVLIVCVEEKRLYSIV